MHTQRQIIIDTDSYKHKEINMDKTRTAKDIYTNKNLQTDTDTARFRL